MIKYQVYHAEFEPCYITLISKPSSQIDDRTIRRKFFNSKAKAFQYAQEYFSSADKKWVAFLEISEVKSKIIKKLI